MVGMLQLTQRTLAALLMFLLLSVLFDCNVHKSESGAKFTVNIDDSSGVRTCEIVFDGPLPNPNVVDAIVRQYGVSNIWSLPIDGSAPKQ